MDSNKIYVYENQEVKLTGREAQKASTVSRTTRPVNTLVEITPTDGINTWTKWVRLQDLYIVVDSEDISNG